MKQIYNFVYYCQIKVLYYFMKTICCKAVYISMLCRNNNILNLILVQRKTGLRQAIQNHIFYGKVRTVMPSFS